MFDGEMLFSQFLIIDSHMFDDSIPILDGKKMLVKQ